VQLRDREALAQLVAEIVVHRDKLIVRFKSDHTDEAPRRSDDPSLTIPWQKPPSKRSRRILLPHNASQSVVRPEQFERRARLVSAIARGRRWLDDVVSGRVTNVTELCAREKCTVRQVNMTISLAFLAPNLVKAAVEGRLPRGIGVERLRYPPTEWSRQFEALGLNPDQCQRRGCSWRVCFVPARRTLLIGSTYDQRGHPLPCRVAQNQTVLHTPDCPPQKQP
jgi:site-specific DNA recombinase